MSNYEFWKDLGKIFNAVVAYQEKSIEFNKRFINPWIKIGNVFDTQDRHREAVRAYQQAVEIDPGNGQTWLELGNAHFRNEAFDEAVTAFQKAIELDPNLGWPYSNLALTYVVQNRHAEARLLYEKSITLLDDDKDKAVSWNRLGNLHRKLNEYDLAMLAFQKADELDKENAGFKDEFDEVLAHVDGTRDDETAPEDMIANSIQLIVEQNESEEKVLMGLEDISTEVPTEPIRSSVVASDVIEVEGAKLEDGGEVTPSALETEEPDTPETVEVSVPADKIETAMTENVTETFTESLAGMESVTETFQSELPGVEDVLDPGLPEQEVPISTAVEDQVPDTSEKAADPVTKVITIDENVPETTQEVVDAGDKVSEPAPEVMEIVEKVSEPVLEVVDENEKATEPVAEVLSTDKEIPETTPELVDAGEKVSEPAPEVMEIVEKVCEPVLEVVDENEKVTEPVAEVLSTNKEVLETTPEVVVEKVGEPVLEVLSTNEEVPETTPEVVVENEKVTEPVAEVLTTNEEVPESTPEIMVEKVEEPVVVAVSNEATVETNAASDQVQESTPEINIQSESNPENNAGTGVKENDADIQPVLMMDEPELNMTGIDTLTPSILDEETIASHEPIAMVDETGGFQLEMDTKNAHVWNELGNVYFNRGSIDDAIVAYSKAIELDRWFAWPYSNLALAYVQKERFAEAMLLYQRSIELFASNKDKAISWNRLGNVYRRLNDYDNAIASYQRADELDPDNSTIYQQSRFSLLGSYQVEQSALLSS